MKNKLRRQLSISLKSDENELLERLEARGITHIAIFLLGLRTYQEQFIDDEKQNNIS